MTITCAALMCHAPIVIPQIAGARGQECLQTTRAMHQVAKAIVAHEPDVVVVISPHAPRHRDAWGIVDSANIYGSFARFGRADLSFALPGAPEAARALTQAADALGVRTRHSQGKDLDHGTLVPLHFVVEAGFRGPILVVALPYPGGGEEAFGRAIARAASAQNQRWAVLASGDMSHRLIPGAPSGFDPRAANFDAFFVDHVRRGALREATRPAPELQELAAEDVVQSTEVAAAAVGFCAHGVEVFSYEGPFGVGYLEALLYSDRAERARASSDEPPSELIDIARGAIAGALGNGRVVVPPLPAEWTAPRAVFVTLRSPTGELRGCIGRTEPALHTLAEEVADCAVSAATRDPRMAPVEASELDDLRIEISVLEPSEPVASLAELDPHTYGVVITQGHRRGVLLPSVEGVETADEQVRIAMRKGHIRPQTPYEIARFRVHKIKSMA